MSSPFNWELIAPRSQDAETNMATDMALLGSGPSKGLASVRFYTWTRPSLSVGANMPAPAEVLERCATEGVEVVTRPTGGGAVLHDGDVTYAVVGPLPSKSVLGTYRWVAQALIAGFAGLGLKASISDHSSNERALACFALPTGADLEVKGRKICGSAQVRRNGWFLQHGSIPLKDIRGQTAHLLGLREPDASTNLHQLIPEITQEQVIEAMASGFVSVWGSPTSTVGLPNPLLLL